MISDDLHEFAARAQAAQQEINSMGFGPVQLNQADVERLANRMVTAERERDDARTEVERLEVLASARFKENFRLRKALRDLIEAGSRGSADFDAEAQRAERVLASNKAGYGEPK